MRIPGSIPFKVMREEAKDREALHIGHPAGVLEVKSSAQITDQGIRMKSIKVFRTARPIMDGTAYITK